MKRSRRFVWEGWGFTEEQDSSFISLRPQNLGNLRHPVHRGIGNRRSYMVVPEGKKGKKKSQTSETVTKITARNVNKILLQAAHSPPHTQHLPPPEWEVKTYKVCVLKTCRAALWEEAMTTKKFFFSMWLILIITRLETVLRAPGWLLI